MRSTFFAILIAIFVGGVINAAETNQPAADGGASLAMDLHVIIGRINDKISANRITEPDLAADIKSLDDLPGRYKGEDTNDLGYILYQEKEVYWRVLQKPAKAKQTLERIIREYPTSQAATEAANDMNGLNNAIVLQNIRDGLTNGVVFPDFQVKDITGKPLSISALKGKVVLVDFWATWCPTCMAEMPLLAATYKKFHDGGLEIVGINQDADTPSLTRFLKDNQDDTNVLDKITWPQYSDTDNSLAHHYGVYPLPATFLIDGTGRIISGHLPGDEIVLAVEKALKAK